MLASDQREQCPADRMGHAHQLAEVVTPDVGVLGGEDDEVFLGKEFTRTRNFSEHTAQVVDAEIRKFVLEAEESASGLLEKNRDKLNAVAEALLVHEVLDNADLDKIMAGEAVVRKDPNDNGNGEVVDATAPAEDDPDTRSGPSDR